MRQVELSLDQAEAYDHVAALLRAAGVDLENNLLVPGRERDARVTALIGKAGSGKTLLLSELYHAMRSIGVEVVSGIMNRGAIVPSAVWRFWHPRIKPPACCV